MSNRLIVAFALGIGIVAGGCSGLQELTDESLAAAEAKWSSAGVDSYRMTLEFSGDRVDTGTFVVVVRDAEVDTLVRNGVPAEPGRRHDYTVSGLFDLMRREREMAQTPALLGAPAGYRVYTRARFDPATGRLQRYDRSVGGASNRVGIKVLEFVPL